MLLEVDIKDKESQGISETGTRGPITSHSVDQSYQSFNQTVDINRLGTKDDQTAKSDSKKHKVHEDQ